MKFEQFVKLVGIRYPEYHWSFEIEDRLFVATCDEGVVCYDPREDTWVMGVLL